MGLMGIFFLLPITRHLFFFFNKLQLFNQQDFGNVELVADSYPSVKPDTLI
jgi:hypothetical protein